jgi:hypothetical protein
MTIHAKQNFITPACARAQAMQDVLLVSSFALWAVLLGLSPVLAFHFVIGS